MTVAARVGDVVPHCPTVIRAIHEIRPLPAVRRFAVPDGPGIRPRTLAEFFAYAEAEGVERRVDGTETQVRRPRAGRLGRKAFVSGKKKQNTVRTTTISDGSGRLLRSGADRPGRVTGSSAEAHVPPPHWPLSTHATA